MNQKYVCKETKDNKLRFYCKTKDDKLKRISSFECCTKGQHLIKNYLAKYNLSIEPLRSSDINTQNKRNNLVNKIEDIGTLRNIFVEVLEDYVDELKYIKTKKGSVPSDISNLITNDEERYTYCAVYDKEIVSLTTSIYNYGTYKDALYIDISFTDSGNRCAIGTNYFLNCYIILEVMKVHPNIEYAWGTMGGDIIKLEKYHKSRKCIVSNNSFTCHTTEFLNTFFVNIEKYKWDESC